MKKTFLVIIFWFLLIIIINKVSATFIPDRTSYELPYKTPFTFTLAPLLNMDGRHYLDIACNGYYFKEEFDLRVFFPVYPLLIKAFSFNCTINPVIVGLLISPVSFLVSFYVLAKMLDNKIRFKTLFLLLFFPTSFFFIAYYTESVFFLFVILTFWFLEKKKYLPASIFAAIASATRLPGIALTFIILCVAYADYLKSKKLRLEVLLAPLGIILFTLYNWVSTGKPFTFISTQAYWDRPIGLLAPVFALKSQIISVASGPLSSYDSPFVYPVILIEFGMLIFLLLILYFSFKTIKKSWWIYVLANIVIILFGGILSASPRYALVLFPVYVFLAERLSGIKYLIYLICSFVLFVFMASLFLRGYWSS